MYPGWKWLTVDCSLFTAYCKAKGLERRVAGMWEVTPSECEIVNERGMIINAIRKVGEHIAREGWKIDYPAPDIKNHYQ